MKKIKMMLLSLALFAVVGGALAFKAKYHLTFCTADAYFDPSLFAPYYCNFFQANGQLTTTQCLGPVNNVTTDTRAFAIQKVCTTVPDIFGGCPGNCRMLTSTIPDR